MEKYALIRKKRDQSIAKRQDKINRRTFPPSSFQLNSIIAPIDIPDIIEPIMEPILLIEKQPETVIQLIENVCISKANQPYEVEVITPDIIIEKPDIINPDIIAQAEEIRKVILLTETIKRFSKKKLII